jgi:hypothetical protein
MPFTYTNRKGFTYFLCQGATKTGKPRYYFAREAKGAPVEQIPEGYELEESVNGIVSLIKARPRLIRPGEVAAVEATLKKHPKSKNYRVTVKHDKIIIHESSSPSSGMFGNLLGGMISLGALQNELDRYAQFTQVMRFILVDAEQRDFIAQRWCYLGSIDDWIDIDRTNKIEPLAKRLAPALGTDAFYELY